MNIENAKIAIDKMAAFLPDHVLNDLYKDHNATAHIIFNDDNKVVFSVIFNNGDKRSLDVTVKRSIKSNDARLHRHEINVHYDGTMQVFSQLITAEFYSDIINALFPEDSSEDVQGEIMDNIKSNKTISEMSQNELQAAIDYIMQYEIPCILELIKNAENERDLKFCKEKLIAAQKRYAKYHLQHLKNFCNM